MPKPHVHKFKFYQRDGAMLRVCRCGERVLEYSRPKGSFIDDRPPDPPVPKKNRRRL